MPLEYAQLDGIETWWGSDIVSGNPETALVTIRGREPDGEAMCLTVRFEDFQQIAEDLRATRHLDTDLASDLAATLILRATVQGCPKRN